MKADQLREQLRAAGGRYWEYYEADDAELTVVMLADYANKTSTKRVSVAWQNLAANPSAFESELVARAREWFARELKLPKGGNDG